MTMQHFKIYCKIAVSPEIMNRAIKISLVVGTTLNLINQGDTLIIFDFASLSITKLLLTYIVPYSVTTYTATAMKVAFEIGTKATLEVDLECKGCGAEIHLKKDELIPKCPTCGTHTHWQLK